MRKTLVLLMVLCCFSVMMSLAHAKDKDARWIEHRPFESAYLMYYEFNNECVVSIHEKEEKIILTAYDSNWHGKTLIQTSTLEKVEDGGVNRNQYFEISPSNGSELADQEEIDKGKYDIFDQKCRVHSENLPDQVKDAFYKYYDISR